MKLEDRLLAYEDQQMTVGNDMDGAILIRDARDLIESLRTVARTAALAMEPRQSGLFGRDEIPRRLLDTLQEVLDALPAWVLKE